MSGVHDRARKLTIVSRQDDANGVQVEVRDSGTVWPERPERVFESFYTTKAEGIASACRSAARSSRPMVGGCPPRRTSLMTVFRFRCVAQEASS